MAEIRLVGVAKSFGGVAALRSIDLAVADREFLVLLGASGCGKTTLLRILAGLEAASAGEVWIGGRRVDRLPPRARGVAMVFQNYAVFPHLTVFENVAFGLRMARRPKAEVAARVGAAAELLHIADLLGRYPSQLSGGQRQRVAVARALATRADVILMDEPLSNLDALLRLEMRAELKAVLAAAGATTVYVTHDQVEAMSLADRIAVMDRGRIVQRDRPTQVYRNPATRFVGGFIGAPPMNFLPAEAAGPGRWRVAGLVLPGPRHPLPRLDFAIRPEDLAPAAAGLAARIRVVEPLGPHTLVTAEAGGRTLRAILPADAAVAPGDALTLLPAPDRIRWFDPDTGEALP